MSSSNATAAASDMHIVGLVSKPDFIDADITSVRTVDRRPDAFVCCACLSFVPSATHHACLSEVDLPRLEMVPRRINNKDSVRLSVFEFVVDGAFNTRSPTSRDRDFMKNMFTLVHEFTPKKTLPDDLYDDFRFYTFYVLWTVSSMTNFFVRKSTEPGFPKSLKTASIPLAFFGVRNTNAICEITKGRDSGEDDAVFAAPEFVLVLPWVKKSSMFIMHLPTLSVNRIAYVATCMAYLVASLKKVKSKKGFMKCVDVEHVHVLDDAIVGLESLPRDMRNAVHAYFLMRVFNAARATPTLEVVGDDGDEHLVPMLHDNALDVDESTFKLYADACMVFDETKNVWSIDFNATARPLARVCTKQLFELHETVNELFRQMF